jgi:hypothetical protein
MTSRRLSKLGLLLAALAIIVCNVLGDYCVWSLHEGDMPFWQLHVYTPLDPMK